MANIAIVTKDPGGHNAVWPAREELLKRGYSILDIAHGKTIEIFAEKGLLPLVAPEEDPKLVLAEMKLVGLPDVYVTSTCSEGGLGRNLIPHLRDLAVPTIAVTDFWGGGQNQFFKEVKFWPDAICVQDQLSKEILLEDWHGYSEERVHITGQPAFDALADMDARNIRRQIRKQIKMHQGFQEDHIPIIVYAGQLQGSAQTLGALVQALNNLPDCVYLALLKHPRMSMNSPRRRRALEPSSKRLYKWSYS